MLSPVKCRISRPAAVPFVAKNVLEKEVSIELVFRYVSETEEKEMPAWSGVLQSIALKRSYILARVLLTFVTWR